MKRWLAILIGALIILALVAVAPAHAATDYTVQPGDTLFGLAARFGTTVNEIVAANGITNPNYIVVGQVLSIPDGASNPPPPGGGGGTSGGGGGSTGGGGTYTVQAGDTLGAIAARFGTTVTAIAQVNGIVNINLIYVGQILELPSGSTGGGTSGGGGTTPPPPPPPGGLAGGFEVGGQISGYGHMDRMNYAGLSWVKIQHKWSAGQSPDVLAGPIQEAHNNGFKVLVSIPGNPYPSPGSIDFGAYVEFLRGVAAYGPDAIEVWNEMNIDFEWPAGEINPSSYVNNMLAPAYNAIKSVNSNIIVVSGAPAPTGFDNNHNAWADDRYIAGMAAAGAANYADCIGVHHNAGATSPTQSFGHPAGSHYSWYYQPTMDLYYNAFGGARKLCITELGYLSGDGFPGLPTNFAWAGNTSVAQHAQWLGEAASLANNSGRVRLLIIFNFNFTFYDAERDPQAGYAMIRPDGSCPACETIRAVTGGR